MAKFEVGMGVDQAREQHHVSQVMGWIAARRARADGHNPLAVDGNNPAFNRRAINWKDNASLKRDRHGELGTSWRRGYVPTEGLVEGYSELPAPLTNG